MSSHLPVISGREALKFFQSQGWVLVRQRGSHMVLTKDGEMASLSVPDHKELRPGTLRSLLRSAGVTVEQFRTHLGQ